MNTTLIEIIKSREDLSDYLYHFTKGSAAFDTLIKIIESNAIKDINKRGKICFTEAPLVLLSNMFKIFDKYTDPLYAHYGIAIKKDILFELGARPVIYGTDDDELHLSDKIK